MTSDEYCKRSNALVRAIAQQKDRRTREILRRIHRDLMKAWVAFTFQ